MAEDAGLEPARTGAGTWAEGNKANPNGRPPGVGDHARFKALCRDFIFGEWQAIKACVRNELADHEAPKAMTKIVMEFGFGKPRQQLDVSVSTEAKQAVLDGSSPEILDGMQARLMAALAEQDARRALPAAIEQMEAPPLELATEPEDQTSR